MTDRSGGEKGDTMIRLLVRVESRARGCVQFRLIKMIKMILTST